MFRNQKSFIRHSSLTSQDDPTTASGVDAGNAPSHLNAEPKTCSHKMGGRNLVVCIDGSVDPVGEKNTNVIQLYLHILKGAEDNQQTWYHTGIWAHTRPSWTSSKLYEQVLPPKEIAWDFDRTVLAAYSWLSDSYHSGDCIFLFGFSRGAFQIRILSAMIDKVGLIHKGNELQIPFAYELYQKLESSTDRTTAAMFKRAFSHEDVRVHFVGAWETVSPSQIARTKYMFPGTVDGMKHVCYFRHALALDERRVKFLPVYAYGGSATGPSPAELPVKNMTTPNGKKEETLDITPALAESDKVINPLPRPLPPHTSEVWFAGTHSDLGGEITHTEGMIRGTLSLQWMASEAEALGLRMSPLPRELRSVGKFEIKESLTWPWWFLEILPIKRLTYTNSEKTSRKPHLGSSRKIQDGQKLHPSVLPSDKSGREYIPKARLVDVPDFLSFWKDLNPSNQWLESDLNIEGLVKMLISEPDNTELLPHLRQMATMVNERQALYEGVIDALRTWDPTAGHDTKYSFLRSAMDILNSSFADILHLELYKSTEICPLLSDLRRSTQKQHREAAQHFLTQFTDPFIIATGGHVGPVLSVAFSFDGRLVASGSSDKTVRIWDGGTGKLLAGPFQGHTEAVKSVAFSPDAQHVVTGSYDGTAHIWDVMTGEQVGEPLQRHTKSVVSVAFSTDGQFIVTGSQDKTILVWRAETREPVGEAFQGHTHWVRSVAFSSDGKHVASGSNDKTVRIWNVATGKQEGEPLQGHTASVNSVAFSRNGKCVVSGSSDMTIRVWDVKKGTAVGEPLLGHGGWVLSIACSPDGSWIVSGSDDKTVRIWDVEGGKQVAKFQGHTYAISTVAFSSDGRRIASGSTDRTIRIWDGEIYASEVGL